MSSNTRVIVGITGASGALYAKRLVECLLVAGVDLHLVVSPWGKRLFRDELGITTIDVNTFSRSARDRLTIHSHQDLGSKLASGSFLVDTMIICPCSSNSLGRMAAGIGDGLITRAAHVTLKEGRRLIIVPREMPTSRIDLQNMLRLQEAGAVICPASPAFYMQPSDIGDLVESVVGKLLDLAHVPHDLHIRWGEDAESSVRELTADSK